MKKYPILNLTKEDMIQVAKEAGDKELLKKIKTFDDAKMNYIANRLGELYCETDYWATLLELMRGLVSYEREKNTRKDRE